MAKTRSACLAALTVLACCAAVVTGELSALARPMIVAQAEAPKIFHGVGKITGMDAATGVLTINHEAIPGLMDAMEMPYEVKPAKLLDGLKLGDKVEFAVNGKNLTIVDISKRAPAQ
jgi:Cu(I)/Ag(I) efflux system periplasmic protein CusF